MIKTISETNIIIMPRFEPGVPPVTACGGYNVQPEPVAPPGTNMLAIKIITARKYTQKLTMLTYGNTISRAPTINGIR